ncbi:hypothetical protein L3Q82_000754 [Scortum barcoo]|uniref:Uncharacterized protein n=1 Tax=Scortum barcoo TaxID=214431 RepID=A0ACB8WDC2_9TELE|nr:hypothetical protein L3Q82_000754 [Scortum barcoo]
MNRLARTVNCAAHTQCYRRRLIPPKTPCVRGCDALQLPEPRPRKTSTGMSTAAPPRTPVKAEIIFQHSRPPFRPPFAPVRTLAQMVAGFDWLLLRLPEKPGSSLDRPGNWPGQSQNGSRRRERGGRYAKHGATSHKCQQDSPQQRCSSEEEQKPGPSACTGQRFAAECEAAAGMRISTSKSEAMVLDRKRVACPLQVGGEVLPQVEEFKYLGVLFTSEGKIEREIDRRIGAASAVMRSVYRTVVVKKELSRKASEALDLPVNLRFPPSPMVMNFG